MATSIFDVASIGCLCKVASTHLMNGTLVRETPLTVCKRETREAIAVSREDAGLSILEFSVNETPMGQTIQVQSNLDINITATGTDKIDWVELLRYQGGDDSLQVIQRWRPEAWSFAVSYVDKDFKPGAMYYFRFRQKHKIRNRAVTAGSSPVRTRE